MRIQEKVKTVGFDWEKKEQVLDKIDEELKELKKEVDKKQNNDNIESEIGDLLFSVINFARFIGVGKTYISKIFERIGLPVFNADLVSYCS